MHGGVRYYNEGSREYREAENIRPIRENVETKGAEDGSARDFNVEAVLMVNKGKIFDLVHDKGFKPVVKYRKLSGLARRTWKGIGACYSPSEATVRRKGWHRG